MRKRRSSSGANATRSEQARARLTAAWRIAVISFQRRFTQGMGNAMLFDRMFAGRPADIVRFSDLDTFRPLEFASGAKSLPLDAKNFSCAHATIHLPACQITMQRSFPRIMDAF